MNSGDTFLRPACSTSDERQHLWIVVTSPNNQNLVLIVNITSFKSWQDQTVTLNAGEHPFITETSCVFYREAEIADNAKLDDAEKAGAILKRECCSKSIIGLIRDGVNASPHTKRAIKNFYNEYK
jgi:hypothetical protein